MRIVAKTDIGNQRAENQDNYRAGLQTDGTVWALVCDGMGGAQGGRLASSLAAEYMERKFLEVIDTLETKAEIRSFLFKLIDETNTIIYNRSKTDESVRGMGTTIVCCVLKNNFLQYVHVGDSRIYTFSQQNLKQITKDHSIVQELLEQGRITLEEAYTHPNKNLITRALGVGLNVDADYGECELNLNDIVLLCSDGLTNYVTDESIAESLQECQFSDMAKELVIKALNNAGLDNITVLLVAVQQAEEISNG